VQGLAFVDRRHGHARRVPVASGSKLLHMHHATRTIRSNRG
jgi:hypothetical protein